MSEESEDRYERWLFEGASERRAARKGGRRTAATRLGGACIITLRFFILVGGSFLTEHADILIENLKLV